MKFAGRFALVALACTAASPAFAQRTGSHIGRNLAPGNAGSLVGIMAECYAELRPAQAIAWLNTWPGSEAEGKIISAELDFVSRCTENDKVVMGGSQALKFKPKAMRRPLGLAMARRVIGTATPAAPATPTPFMFADVKGFEQSGGKVDAAEVAYLDFGHCVATSAWAGSVALVRSNPGTPEEAAALKQVIPALGPCLSEGMKVELRRDSIRDVVGEPVFHLMKPVPKGNG